MIKNNQTEDTMQAFSAIKKVDAPLFFTENVMERIKELQVVQNHILLRRIKWALSIVVFLAVANSFVFVLKLHPKTPKETTRESLLNSFGKEYLITDSEMF